ncbi:hypothetical protein pCPXV0017 [Cowpox virus]|uniref:Uncharacterized protein n=1 Tax=Cowpox virus TaxID=10243 RepID=A0A212PY15_COWPX|nr:hypothetical protein pCPXV0017 [Cowpox virus]
MVIIPGVRCLSLLFLRRRCPLHIISAFTLLAINALILGHTISPVDISFTICGYEIRSIFDSETDTIVKFNDIISQ